MWKWISACFITHVACATNTTVQEEEQRPNPNLHWTNNSRLDQRTNAKRHVKRHDSSYCQWNKFCTCWYEISALSRFLPYPIHKWHPQRLSLRYFSNVEDLNCRWTSDRKYGRSTGSVWGLDFSGKVGTFAVFETRLSNVTGGAFGGSRRKLPGICSGWGRSWIDSLSVAAENTRTFSRSIKVRHEWCVMMLDSTVASTCRTELDDKLIMKYIDVLCHSCCWWGNLWCRSPVPCHCCFRSWCNFSFCGLYMGT